MLAAGLALTGLLGVRLLARPTEVVSAFPGVTVVALSGQVEAPTAEGVVQTSPRARARIETSQGFRLYLAEDSQVSVRELAAVGTSSTLRLERGRVRCVIPHDPGRTFAVVTADARILDVGTTFSVIVQPTPSGPKTAIDVEEGEVLVEHAWERKRLTAGQFWTSPSAPAAPTPRTTAPVVEEPTPREPRPAGASRRDARGLKRSAETLSTETQLLREGLASEQRGDLRRAAAFFEQLSSQYPGSPLAPDAKAALKRVRARLASAP